MKTLDKTRKAEQIKEAHAHLDIVEAEFKRIFNTIKIKRVIEEVKTLNNNFIDVLKKINN